jgi:ABC-2 type transport system ATP-binding protein
MSSALAVQLSDLSKSFRTRRARQGGFGATFLDLVRPRSEAVLAIDRISFAVASGERVAFVGPNGAGKSTTLKVLSGILQPDSGHAEVLGLVPWRERRKLAFSIGTVFGQRSQLWYHLPARDTFELLARVYEVDKARHERRKARLFEAFQLGRLLDRPVSQLSLGERMRCEIVASLLHEPRILFLDEPTIGLDVSAKAEVRALLQEQSNEDGATLLLTSHDTGDIEQVCSRVLVIHGGRMLWDGSLTELRRRYIRSKQLTLWSEREALCLDAPGVRTLVTAPYKTVVEVDLSVTSVGAVVVAALQASPLRDLAIEDAPLDEVIRTLYAEAEASEKP